MRRLLGGNGATRRRLLTLLAQVARVERTAHVNGSWLAPQPVLVVVRRLRHVLRVRRHHTLMQLNLLTEFL